MQILKLITDNRQPTTSSTDNRQPTTYNLQPTTYNNSILQKSPPDVVSKHHESESCVHPLPQQKQWHTYR